MLSPERLDQRQAGWVALLDRYGVAPVAALTVFDRLVAVYSEPHRHYHDLKHIDEVLRVVARLRDYVTDAAAVELAVWLHDTVYDPHGSDNEERSAALATELLGTLGLPAATVTAVADMVRVTTHTHPGPIGRDAAVLLDADLAILGAAEVRYDQYAAAIRREYAWVPEADYRAGRSQVLKAFLGRPRIYRTERMHAAGDAAARANLERELATLAAG